MQIIDGKKIAEKIKEQIKQKIIESGIKPGIGVLIVGNRADSKMYVSLKERACSEVGIHFELLRFPEKTTEQELLIQIDKLNKSPEIHAILVQLPLPKHINENIIINSINESKDVDGYHPKNVAKFIQGKNIQTPVLIKAVDAIISSTQKKIENLRTVILGNSTVFVEPLAIFLKRKKINVISFAPTPKKLPSEILSADIVISALGRPRAIKTEHVKNDAILIDIGITKMKDGSVIGDFDFDSIQKKEGYITPVPGGVGPVTVAELLQNIVDLTLQKII